MERSLQKDQAVTVRFATAADVINRIIESRKPGGQDKLQKAIIEETINPLVQTMCRQAKINPMNIYRMSVAANTTMNHLLIGVNADPVRMEPYIPTFFKTNSILQEILASK